MKAKEHLVGPFCMSIDACAVSGWGRCR